MKRTARQKLQENISDDKKVILIDEEAFRESLVGVTDDMRAVYDFDKMVSEYAKFYSCGLSDAREYIEDIIVSRIRKIGSRAPIIMDALI